MMDSDISNQRADLADQISNASKAINVADLTPVLKPNKLKLEDDIPIEVTIWSIKEVEKKYKGQSQGLFPTFEVTIGTNESYIIQSKSRSSYAMLDDWDDKRAPCHAYVWKTWEGTKSIIMWAYREN